MKIIVSHGMTYYQYGKYTYTQKRNLATRIKDKITLWQWLYRRRWGPNVYQRIRSRINHFRMYRRVWYLFYDSTHHDQRQSDFRFTLDFSHPWWSGFSIIWGHRFLIVNYYKEYSPAKYPSKHTIKIFRKNKDAIYRTY